MWSIVGALVAFALVSVASVGVFVVPIAAIAALLAARYLGIGLELLGLVMGAAAISLLVALLNLDYRPCPAGDLRLEPGAMSEQSCGGFNPLPWFVAAGGLAVASVAGYTIGRGRTGRSL